jgi:hypothetical protein
MLGNFHTMGRTIPGQHRKFIEKFVEKGWLKTLAEPNSSAESLIRILDEYLYDPFCRAEYYEWMKQFISFYQSSRWLTTYVFSLAEMDKIQERFPLSAVFNVRENPWFSGTGIDAPPLDRALGIGGCFLVREFIRRGLLSNPFAYEHAYVPKAGTRAVLAKLGCAFPEGQADATFSLRIHEFLVKNLDEERATFGKYFDIPFAIMAKHPELLDELSGIDIEPLEEPVEYFDD